jgi:chromosome segregation ATPase/CheY-like chemotaxis protein
MKKLFVADEDVQFQDSVKKFCPKGGDVTPRFFSSSMEILPLIEKEQPALVFVNLELSDMNDFVMYDLLKKADTQPPIPVIITYRTQSEKDLDKYKKLKFKPEGYFKKVLSPEDIAGLLTKYLGINLTAKGSLTHTKKQPHSADEGVPGLSALDDDDIIFTEVMGDTDDALEPFISDGKDHPMADIVNEPLGDGKPKEAVFSVSDGPSVDVMEKTRYREQAARLISLEKQNHYLRTENTRYAKEEESLKKKIQDLEKENQELSEKIGRIGFEDTAEKSRLEKTAAELKEKTSEFQLKSAQFQKKAIEMEKKVEELEASLKTQQDELKKTKETAEKEKADLVNRVNDLNDRLTDKQRELIAKDHEFEKRLQNETDDLIRETEERIASEFKEKEERLRADIARLENDKMRLDNAHKDEVNRLKSASSEQQVQIESLKHTEAQLQNTVNAIEEEKESISRELETQKEKIHALKEEKETIIQQLKCSEEDLASAIKEKEKSETVLSASVEKLTMELHSMKEELDNRKEMTDEYRNRLDGLGKLLQQALLLTGESSGK